MSDSLTTPRSDTLPPDAISDVLLPVVEELGLVEHCRQLAREGWTVIEHAADPAFVARLRDRILADGTSFMRLDKDPLYAEAALNPKVMAIAEFSVGRGFLLYGLTTTVRGQGAPAMHVHADQALVPAPFPDHNMMIVACWACDASTREGGGTLVVPGRCAVIRGTKRPPTCRAPSRSSVRRVPSSSGTAASGTATGHARSRGSAPCCTPSTPAC